MVGPTITNDTEETLAQQQAAGLRALADLITRHPALAPHLEYVLRGMHEPLTSRDGDVRAVLEAFHAAAMASGATVTVDNREDQCRVRARFGPVAVLMTAEAALMAGQQPSAPKYAPLAVEGVSTGA